MLAVIPQHGMRFSPIKFTDHAFHQDFSSYLFQDYEDFDLANEDDELEEFLGIPRKTPKSVPVNSSKAGADVKPLENGENKPAAEATQNG